jgi:hypothetical protein
LPFAELPTHQNNRAVAPSSSCPSQEWKQATNRISCIGQVVASTVDSTIVQLSLTDAVKEYLRALLPGNSVPLAPSLLRFFKKGLHVVITIDADKKYCFRVTSCSLPYETFCICCLELSTSMKRLCQHVR